MYKRILILEDDASYGAMLKTWFVKNDWLVSLVTKVGTAQHELSSNAFNLASARLSLFSLRAAFIAAISSLLNLYLDAIFITQI